MIDQKTYPDETILMLRQKLREKQLIKEQAENEIIVGMERVPVIRMGFYINQDDSQGFSILLPFHLEKMAPEMVVKKYPMVDRPEIILTDHRNDIAFLLNRIKEETEDIDKKMQKIKEMLQRAYKKNIFYDSGTIIDGKVPVSWFEYKGNYLKGKFYCLSFGFYMEEHFIFGNFQCSFELYDYWKDAVLKLLRSIKCCNR